MSNKKNEGRWVRKARKPLSPWEVLPGLACGGLQGALRHLREQHQGSRMLDSVDPPPTPALDGGRRRRSAERKLLEKGYVETETKDRRAPPASRERPGGARRGLRPVREDVVPAG
jgi:hypothetical protein